MARQLAATITVLAVLAALLSLGALLLFADCEGSSGSGEGSATPTAIPEVVVEPSPTPTPTPNAPVKPP